MQLLITGGGGFLGQRLAAALLNSTEAFDELVLVDLIQPSFQTSDPRVRFRQADLTDPSVARALVGDGARTIFHLAAVVSSHAEKDFDLGWRVNLDVTRHLLEACRRQKAGIRFIFTSSLAVFGGLLPKPVNDFTATMPRSSYGSQKAMGELLVNDYSRKGFVDGVVLRLPTICVRPGRPNQAASSFVSSIIREPLNGEDAICPVDPKLELWLSSPDTVVKNLLHAASLDTARLDGWRVVNLPGIGVTVEQMIDALARVAGPKTVSRITFRLDPAVNAIVSSWPGVIDNTRGLSFGFDVDQTVEHLIKQFIDYQKNQG